MIAKFEARTAYNAAVDIYSETITQTWRMPSADENHGDPYSLTASVQTAEFMGRLVLVSSAFQYHKTDHGVVTENSQGVVALIEPSAKIEAMTPWRPKLSLVHGRSVRAIRIRSPNSRALRSDQ